MFQKIILMICFFGALEVCAVRKSPSRISHPSSYPYIAGDSFRAFADFAVDDTRTLEPSQVKTGDVVFVQSDYLEKFFTTLHPHIVNPYILVTPNTGTLADDPMPGRFWRYVEDKNLGAWFTQNIDTYHHPKIFAMPIGIANQCWPHGNVQIFNHYIKNFKNRVRTKLLYMNFSASTYPQERTLVWNLFAHGSFCTVKLNRKLAEYLDDMSQHKFVLSPRGHGLDCHRTWEALLMGSIPVVRASTLDVLYKDLPVLIVNDWHEVTEEFLERKYQEIMSKTYNVEKIYVQYWFDQIHEVQKELRIQVQKRSL